MLKIQCNQCGSILKGKEVNITTFDNYVNGVKYKDYAVTCSKCGSAVRHERIAKQAEKNKAKAMAKVARKTGQSVKQLTEEEEYNAAMYKALEIAKNEAKKKKKPVVKIKHLNRAIDKLPKKDRDIVLAHEDKMNMEMLKSNGKKDTDHIKSNSILLLTQAIIEQAIADNDEDFFMSEYGSQIVDTYNTMLTEHKKCDYNITADLLLEKMRKKTIHIKGEREDD